MHTTKNKTLALTICVIFVMSILFSMLFVVKGADHDCSGENCPICACISLAKQTLKQLGSVSVAAAGMMVCFSLILAFIGTSLTVPCATLISQKVRLND